VRIRRKLYKNPVIARIITKGFHRLYYDVRGSQTWKKTFWLGNRILKCPLDLWIYQEIIYELKPDVIIETGTADGGSALFFASLFDLLGKGRILTIDLQEKKSWPKHERITYLVGSSVSDRIVEEVRRSTADADRVMVVLDSDHSMKHVLEELQLYSEFVTRGSYLVVEDTNLNGHPVYPHFGPGPMEAVKAFLRECRAFAVDKERERFSMTFNPNGYLKRIT